MFSSPAFIVAMALLAASILACTAHRLPNLYQAAFHPHTKVKASFFTRAKLQQTATSTLPAEQAMAAVEGHFRLVRARVIAGSGDDEGERNLYADRFHLAPFGTALAHLAFVVIMAGVLVSSLTGFRDEAFSATVGMPREVGHGTGLTVEATSFQDSYYEDGQPKDYVSHLVVTRDGQPVAQQDVRVNEPLIIDGVYFHQASFGNAAVLTITDDKGATVFSDGVPLRWTTSDQTLNYGIVELPALDREVVVVASASGRAVPGVEPGQVRAEVYPLEGDDPLGVEVLNPGGKASVAGLDFSFEREQKYTGLLIKKDPGALVVWIGCAMLMLGTCLTMFLRHHRIWIRATNVPDGGSVIRFASPDRADAVFSRRFSLIAAAASKAIARAEKES